MNEEPTSFGQKTRKGSLGRVLIIAALVAFSIGVVTIGRSLTTAEDYGAASILGLVILFVLFGLLLFVRRLYRRGNFQRVGFGFACLVTLVALFYAEEDWRGKHDWEKFKRAWEAKGERFDRAGVVPPAVPDNQNFALTPVAASSYETVLDQNGHAVWPRNTNVINRLRMNPYSSSQGNSGALAWPTNGDWRAAKTSDLNAWQQYYRALAAKTNEFPVPSQPQSPAADVLLALSKYDSAIQELRQSAQLRYSRFPLEYDKDDPAAILLPHLAALKSCSHVLQLRALAELQNGQSDLALADIELILRLTDSVRTEPILISHLVRIAMLNIALQPVWEGLAGHRWSDAQLAELDRKMAGLDFISDYRLAMRGEMALFQGGIFEYLRHHPGQLANLVGDSATAVPIPALAISRLVPVGWFYQNQLHCARPMVEFYLPAADVNLGIFSPKTIQQADATIVAETRQLNPCNALERLLLPALGNAAKKFAQGQNAANLALAATALERYRLAHGDYPQSFDALTPQFIAKLPPDVINGHPLHYQHETDGQFVLYSVGWNETDEDGEASLNKSGAVDINQGDWAWRYPTK